MSLVLSLVLGATPSFFVPQEIHGPGTLGVDLTRLLDQLYYDVDAEGAHWVRSPSYKAKVDSHGLTYIPFLGSEAPENAPVRFEYDSITVNGVHAAPGSPITVTRSRDRISIMRGNLEERFDFSKESVEHSFLLAEGLRGDLAITVRVIADESYLSNRDRSAPGTWVNGAGGVAYGDAFAVTDVGDRTALARRAEGDLITIEVPAAVTASATGRLLVDPIISTLTFGPPVLNDPITPSAAYDPTTGRYMGSVTTYASASDGDIFSFFIDPVTGNVSDGAFTDMTTENWEYGLVGNHASLGQFVTVARVEGVGMKTRFRLAVDGTVYAPKLLRGDTATSAVIPTDVGSDPYPSPAANFAVAYIERSATADDFLVTTIDINGDPASTPVVLEAGVPEFVSIGPRLSSTTGSADLDTQWTAAWITGSSSADRSVRAAVIDYDGTVVDAPATLYSVAGSSAGFFLDVSSPTELVDGASGRQVTAVAFDSTNSGGEQSFHFLRCAGTSVLSEHDLNGLVQTGEGFQPRFASLADGWLLHFRDGGAPLRLATVRDLDGFPALAHTPESVTAGDQISYDLVSAYEFGDAGSEQGLTLSTGGTPRILSGAILEAATGTPAASQYCVAAPNSTGERGYLYALGDRSPFTPKTLVAERVKPFAAGLFIGGLEPTRIPMLSGTSGTLCVNQGLGRFLDSLAPISPSGTASFLLDPTSIPTATGPISAMSGGVHYFQFWHRDTNDANLTGAIAMRFE